MKDEIDLHEVHRRITDKIELYLLERKCDLTTLDIIRQNWERKKDYDSYETLLRQALIDEGKVEGLQEALKTIAEIKQGEIKK